MLVVDTARAIIDAVRPTRSCYTLEPMPRMLPDSPDSYLQLLDTIDRPAFAAHLDPVNWVNSPQRYFANAALIREAVAKLGPHIRSCHAKDIVLRPISSCISTRCAPAKAHLTTRSCCANWPASTRTSR